MERPSDEVAEIERHKYFLSEKSGQDVGWDTAEDDWEREHAAQWRATRHTLSQQSVSKAANGQAASTVLQDSAQQDSLLNTDAPEEVAASRLAGIRQGERHSGNWFKRLLGRFSA